MRERESESVELTLHYRRDSASGKASAFWQGEYEDRVSEKTGQVFQNEKLIWLPKSQIQVEVMKDDVCLVTIPEWIAKKEGLI
jgi:hypothetical protein